jgi:uncharacterized membrane protein
MYFDKAGMLFSIVLIAGTLALVLRVFAGRASVDPPTKLACRTMVVAAFTNGVVNVAGSAGLMPDNPTYQTLELATVVAWGGMLWVCFYRARRARKIGRGA